MITPNSHMNPVYGKEEVDSVTDYINSGGWIMEHTMTRELESKICEFTGAKYAHMVTSATTGLLCASMVAKIQPGEKFAVSAYTQAATCNGAILMGGIPVIVDVDPVSYCINFDKIPNDCRVIFVSAINGRYPKYVENRIKSLREAGKIVIEDSAQALGSRTENDVHCGTMGDMGVFSFGAPKIITTGQGGVLLTNSTSLSSKLASFRDFGRSSSGNDIHPDLGLNFKFTDLQAVLGISQLSQLEDRLNAKKQAFSYLLSNVQSDFLSLLPNDTNVTAPWFFEVVSEFRDQLFDYLASHNVRSRKMYPELNKQKCFSRHPQFLSDFPVSSYISRCGLWLPSYAHLSDEELCYIAKVLNQFIPA